ncbi:Dothistromin biosynthesis peroxidase dotB [Pseudocercospora fuligena]|uniref:Dothistromin biosynthesis peroxidase dotB n=1 Tax=Pseudocercospora fuligena TaxID=685502 RepID=A0A8H6RU24_9PEZI|nr:Dothistromin biosynthesis peroxidase dotB [Pseudocercospora fuligena]
MLSKAFATAALLNAAAAFPHIAQMVEKQRMEERQVGVPDGAIPFPEWPGSPLHASFNKFDASSQLVSTSGDHAWQAPGPGDIRGPCAGLNAAANHGYLPRSGIVDANAINTGLWEAFGLDKTATIFLQTATSFFNGDPVSGRWSIGYHSDKTQSLGAVGDLLGNETGICAYGHLRSEGDASITRGDWLAPSMNSNCASYPVFMQELLDLAKARTGGNLTPRVMAEHSDNRKKYSIANNPNYFSPPYAGIAFTFGAHMFAFELLANHSATEPRGFLTPEVFMSFFSYTKDASGNLQYKYGHERIPDNWYRRHNDDAWTLNDITISTAQQCASYPSACLVGGNTGEVNSFDGFDLGDISGGFVNSVTDLSDPQRMACFIAQAIRADTPSFLDNVFSGATLSTVLGLVGSQMEPVLKTLGDCPNLPAGKSVFGPDSKYPGARMATSGNRNPFKK